MLHIQGDGGHASVVRDILRHPERYPATSAFIAVGDNAARKREAERLKDFDFVVAVHHSAIVSPSASIGDGTVVMAGAVVQAGARIGRHVILNTGCSVDHGCVVEDFAHIAPGAHLCGGVRVGEGALVGVGVGLEPGCIVPAWHIVKRERYVVQPVPSN